MAFSSQACSADFRLRSNSVLLLPAAGTIDIIVDMVNCSFQRAPQEHRDRTTSSINRVAGSLRQAATAMDDIHNLMHSPPSTTLPLVVPTIPPPPLPTPSPPQLGPFPHHDPPNMQDSPNFLPILLLIERRLSALCVCVSTPVPKDTDQCKIIRFTSLRFSSSILQAGPGLPGARPAQRRPRAREVKTHLH